ncbi:hypothetical protein [Falsiroseomonas oryzae]|uniref:hypothetical protein n=1 Tax=Falsiroseomonas oryzae TaxID=2766473 RepID=UPI0022EB362F|nr:hypothetical protein [Roseomonas sp. MO-31]
MGFGMQMRRQGARAGAKAGALGLALLVAACGSGPAPGSTAPCPRIAILAEGADITRFRQGAPRDLTAQVVDVRISGFEATCDFIGRDTRRLAIRVTPRFDAELGPAAQGRTVDLPWFVALTNPEDTAELARRDGIARMVFPPNVQRTTFVARPEQLTLTVEEGRRAAEYLVRVSLQLTPDELAQNRQRGPR